MKSKLYLLFALMSVTAVFASPALAAPPVPTITSPTTGTVVGATVLINISTDVASDSVEVRGLGGVLLGTAEPTDASNTSFLLAADLSETRRIRRTTRSPRLPRTLTARLSLPPSWSSWTPSRRQMRRSGSRQMRAGCRSTARPPCGRRPPPGSTPSSISSTATRSARASQTQRGRLSHLGLPAQPGCPPAREPHDYGGGPQGSGKQHRVRDDHHDRRRHDAADQ